MNLPEIGWECGTAYDFFISLHVLHHPAKYELRGAWAAGVRSRLPQPERETMEEAATFIFVPLAWIHSLPGPKDSATALRALAELPPAERVGILTRPPVAAGEMPVAAGEMEDILQRVAARGSWQEQDLQALKACCGNRPAFSPRDLLRLLDAWARPVAFGQRFLQALQTYRDVFFAEEEKRIEPALKQALEDAQQMARQLPLPELLEELSQGVRYSDLPEGGELLLAPSFWVTPLLVRGRLAPDRELLLFGARSSTASLVPGEVVPDALFRALKALADPTRLRILRYLSAESLTPSELAQRLRLRAPTVIHHLHTLRLAGLVYLCFEAGDKRYAARSQTVAQTFRSLTDFLAESTPEKSDA
jgi:DNA-binding transcriptional ArsR family regulator